MMNERDLFRLKSEIEQAKQELANLEGKEEMIMKDLKNQFNCNSIEEAEKLHDIKMIELEKLQEAITEDLNQLEIDYGE